MLRNYLTALLGFICLFSTAQVTLKNASFEDEPQDATVPTAWHPCELGTTPDILPGPWGVVNPPSEGETYMGLISRDDGSYESVGQRLSEPLKADECYRFSIKLAHSNTYASYNMPLKLRVWACQTRCSKDQMIAETELINHKEWKNYTFEFFPKAEFNYIIFEAYFADGFYGDYKGNILLDDCSPIKDCQRAYHDQSAPPITFTAVFRM